MEAKFQEEEDKARRRAARFGIPFTPIDRQLHFARELKAATRMRHDRGFFPMDLANEEEQARLQARAVRFGITAPALQQKAEDELEAQRREGRAVRFGVRPRPPSKWKFVEEELGILNPLFLYKKKPGRNDSAPSEFVKAAPEKIHIAAIDSDEFKAIRSPDILKWLDGYHPRYVEWLGDTSANVWFDDNIAAKRALEATSKELPSLEELKEEKGDLLQLPSGGRKRRRRQDVELVDLVAFGWRVATQPIVKSRTDVHGEQGTAVRILMRPATDRDVYSAAPEASKAKAEAFLHAKRLRVEEQPTEAEVDQDVQLENTVAGEGVQDQSGTGEELIVAAEAEQDGEALEEYDEEAVGDQALEEDEEETAMFM